MTDAQTKIDPDAVISMVKFAKAVGGDVKSACLLLVDAAAVLVTTTYGPKAVEAAELLSRVLREEVGCLLTANDNMDGPEPPRAA